ncbi:hypothetical protein V2I01_41530 [Micromonospora sp. BRA006-A]|nr:hypothetical protein [Micromonospora sp. BRA006-A]
MERLRGQSRLGYTLLRDLMPEPHTAPLPGRPTAAVAAELAICGRWPVSGRPAAPRWPGAPAGGRPPGGGGVVRGGLGVRRLLRAEHGGRDGGSGRRHGGRRCLDRRRAEHPPGRAGAARLGGVAPGRETRAIRHFDRALRIATTARNDVLVPYLRSGRSCAARQLGLLDQARADAVEAERYADRLELDTMHRFARIMRTAVVYWQDGPAAALRLAEPVVRSSADDWFGSVVQRIHAQMRDECADRANTLTLLIRACGGTTLRAVDCATGPTGPRRCPARPAGGRHRGGPALRQAERHAGACDLPGQQAHVALARARIAMATDLPAAAAAGAAEAFAQLGWPLEEAAARLVHAKALDGCTTGRPPRRAWTRCAASPRLAAPGSCTGPRSARRAGCWAGPVAPGGGPPGHPSTCRRRPAGNGDRPAHRDRHEQQRGGGAALRHGQDRRGTPDPHLP